MRSGDSCNSRLGNLRGPHRSARAESYEMIRKAPPFGSYITRAVWIEKLGDRSVELGAVTDAVLAPADKIGDRTSTRSSHASVRIEAYSSTLTSAGDARALIES